MVDYSLSSTHSCGLSIEESCASTRYKIGRHTIFACSPRAAFRRIAQTLGRGNSNKHRMGFEHFVEHRLGFVAPENFLVQSRRRWIDAVHIGRQRKNAEKSIE